MTTDLNPLFFYAAILLRFLNSPHAKAQSREAIHFFASFAPSRENVPACLGCGSAAPGNPWSLLRKHWVRVPVSSAASYHKIGVIF